MNRPHICLNLLGDIAPVTDGLAFLLEDLNLELSDRGLPVTVCFSEEKTLTVTRKDGAARITVPGKAQFFRALGLLLEHWQEETLSLREPVSFDMNGVMFDVCQGNTMMTVDHAKRILRRMALMGLNMMMLYNEDCYDVPGWEYFGYMRSRYSREEVRAIDDYAFALGIEIIPCIQTLAHLSAPLRWPCFNGMRESPACLLPDNKKVYEFIEAMIVAATEPVRSKRIHIGMDEAQNFGKGEYQELHGPCSAGKLMLKHLDRVREILARHDLKPMLWCDMFYNAAYGGESEYGWGRGEGDPSVCENYPRDVQLISYCYDDRSDEYLDRFFEHGKNFGVMPVFGGGIWGWMSFVPQWEVSFANAVSCLQACKRHGIRDVFATTWGDDSAECPADAHFLGMQLYAEMEYSDSYDPKKLAERYYFVTGARMEETLALSEMDRIPSVPDGNPDHYNASKLLLWQDPLCGLFDKDIQGQEDAVEAHYSALAAKFRKAAETPSDMDYTYGLIYRLADVLTLKASLGCRLKAAYDAGDRTALRKLTEDRLPKLVTLEQELYRYHRENFFRENKALGWEVFDQRYAALIQRTQTAIWRLTAYLEGNISSIEELAEERRYYHGRADWQYHLSYLNTVSAGLIQ